MENIYFSSTLRWHEPAEQVVRQAASDQLPGIEIWAPHVFFHDSDPLVIRKTTEQAGMHFTMHAPSWDLNSTSFDRSVRLKQDLQTVVEGMDTTSASWEQNLSFIRQHFQAKEHVI
ncbi:hypothetical protein SAMN05421503_2230 [Terribacillus aidingensis]|uniref:Xylose isomerase-like TIM barrel n=1 Tax=Terribacillus aidingensis TaxID=586416 RepID=A0A285NXE9_9BACI|nr:hypothetical protein [Terribacillus aidingensis]SNZ14109.1 hypothetical protein SAMN05421503_2230 [Terribacillus aidingensis]